MSARLKLNRPIASVGIDGERIRECRRRFGIFELLEQRHADVVCAVRALTGVPGGPLPLARRAGVPHAVSHDGHDQSARTRQPSTRTGCSEGHKPA